ncbi:MAG: VOC family protein [Candidatus Saccharimonadales bacterium]
MGRVIHFEIAVDDAKRAKKFYEQALDWKIEKVSSQDYWVIYTGNKEKTGINGGLMPRRGHRGVGGHNAFVCSIDVDDINKARQKIEKAGGKLTTDVIAMGDKKYCYCKDTEGNSFSIFEA